jgi:hypothetical protein
MNRELPATISPQILPRIVAQKNSGAASIVSESCVQIAKPAKELRQYVKLRGPSQPVHRILAHKCRWGHINLENKSNWMENKSNFLSNNFRGSLLPHPIDKSLLEFSLFL